MTSVNTAWRISRDFDPLKKLESNENILKKIIKTTEFNNLFWSKQMTRPTWSEYFKEIVQCTAKRSPCHRLQVGCLLVRENRIISQGYNGYLPGCPHVSFIRDNHEQAIVHAEQNAICDCAKRSVSTNHAEVYITHYPCIICTRLLLAAGVEKIFYIEDYKNDMLVQYMCQQKNVPIIKL